MEKLIYETVSGTAGSDLVVSSSVPDGKRRVVVNCHMSHTAAAPVQIEYQRGRGGAANTEYCVLQSSADGYNNVAANPGLVGAAEGYPLKKPVVLSEGEHIACLGTMGALEAMALTMYYAEWYYEWEAPPWQLNFL